jgi:hypothetical protein
MRGVFLFHKELFLEREGDRIAVTCARPDIDSCGNAALVCAKCSAKAWGNSGCCACSTFPPSRTKERREEWKRVSFTAIAG